MPLSPSLTREQRFVSTWLGMVYLAIGVMVVVGGVTRLTGSGLSMVTWRPLMGTLPPIGDAAWVAVFEEYKTFPQYQSVNSWMTLSDFKAIFFWEYIHRLWGRVIGLIFILPWLYFVSKGYIRGAHMGRTLVAFVLGGLQGLLGWYMVKSGLVDEPAVSHYRLAAHLSLAFFVGMYVLWLFFDSRQIRLAEASRAVQRWSIAFLVLLSAQIIYGAFMAGTRAGYMYQTFPDMNGVMVPAGLLQTESLWLHLTSNHDAIHFLHRSLGWATLLAGGALAFIAYRKGASLTQKWAALALPIALLAQFGLGVLTVVFAVPVWLGALHQAGAYILLSLTLWLMYCHKGPQSKPGTP